MAIQIVNIAKTPAATNTGPLLSAFQCGRINLVLRYFEPLYIVPSIIEECRRHSAEDELVQLINVASVVIIGDLSDEEQQQAQCIARQIAISPYSKVPEPSHHLPEAEVMVIATRVDLNCEAVLLEEKAAREVGRAMGLDVTGFVGVLIKAAQEGLLFPDEIRTLLEECRSIYVLIFQFDEKSRRKKAHAIPMLLLKLPCDAQVERGEIPILSGR